MRRSLLRSGLMALGIWSVGLVGCADDPLQTAVSADFQAPPVSEVLYPAADNALFAHPGWKRLPADVPFAVVADLPAALTASGMAATIAKGKEPYDQLVKAASVHALGLALASVTELGGAGLDLASAWGMSEVKNNLVIFGRVADRAALKAKLAEHAKAEDTELEEKAIGGGTWWHGKSKLHHAVYVVDDVVFLIPLRYGHDGASIVEALAAVKPGESLGAKPEFAASVAGVKYGSHAAAFFSLGGTTENMKATGDVELLERRFGELEEWLDKNADDPEDAEKVAEVKERLTHKDAEIAAAKARAAKLEGLPPLFGVAFGFDVDPTTVRGKGFLPLSKETAKLVFGPARLAVDPVAKPAAGDRGPKLVNHYDVALSPDAAVEVLAGQLGTTRLRKLRRWLGEGVLEKALSGAVGFARYRVDDLPQSRLEIGLLPGESAKLSERLNKVASDEELTVERDGARLHLVQKTKYGQVERWVRVYDGGVVVASHADLLNLRPGGGEEGPPAVLALASMPPSDGVLTLQTSELLFGSGFGSLRGIGGDSLMIARQAALRDAAAFGMIGLLNSGSGGSFMAPPPRRSRDRDRDRDLSEEQKKREKRRKKIERKRKRLEKRRAKIRAELATLRQRRRIESNSGRTRVLTALGSTEARVSPGPDGVRFYLAQRIAEIDMNALGEHLAYALVDTSSQSETAQQIEELDKKLEGINKALEDLPPSYMFSIGSMSSSADFGSALDEAAMGGLMTAGDGYGGLGIGGIGRGGGGSAVGIGSMGRVDTGSGRGYGSGAGKTKSSDDD